MSNLLKEIRDALDRNNIKNDELSNYDKRLCNEYNNITREYRELFQKIKIKMDENKKNIIKSCNHNYIRYSEYHNDRYFICDKCGHEKY